MEIHDAAVSMESVRSKEKRAPVSLSAELQKEKQELLARMLGGLIDGGVPILKALEGLERAATDRQFKTLLADIRQDLRHGSALSAALEKSGKIPAFFYRTVYGGELSGRVPGVLEDLSRYLAKELTLRRSIRDALVYPAFIIAVGFLTIGILLGFVLPKLQIVYAGFDAELPLLTRLIMALSKGFLPLSALLLSTAAYLGIYWKKNGISVLKKTPILRGYFEMFARVRFARLLSLLLEAGVPALDALGVVETAFTDEGLRRDVAAIKESLSRGGSFSGGLSGVDWMDSLSRMIVMAAEETGRLGFSFSQIARDTERELEAKIHLTVKLLEPAMIVVMGFSVGLIVIGTLLPIFDMSGLVQ